MGKENFIFFKMCMYWPQVAGIETLRMAVLTSYDYNPWMLLFLDFILSASCSSVVTDAKELHRVITDKYIRREHVNNWKRLNVLM